MSWFRLLGKQALSPSEGSGVQGPLEHTGGTVIEQSSVRLLVVLSELDEVLGGVDAISRPDLGVGGKG